MAAARKLARHITIDGTTYGPGDDVPAEVAERIRNPKAWVAVDTEPEPPKGTGKGGTTGGARLAGSVTVDGVTYTPDDHLTDEVAERIRNPKAWEGGRLPGAKKATPVKKTAPKPPADQPPPPAGPGSGEGTGATNSG